MSSTGRKGAGLTGLTVSTKGVDEEFRGWEWGRRTLHVGAPNNLGG